MAALTDISRLVDELGRLQRELSIEMEMGGDLDICASRCERIESIAATLGFAFRGNNEAITEQVKSTFTTPAALTAA